MSPDRPNLQSLSPIIILLGRILFAAIFVVAGARHFSSQTIAMAASMGAPMPSLLVPFSGILSVVGGLSVAVGYRAKIGAWLIILFLIGVTPVMHNFWAATDPMMFQMQMAHFMKNVSMLGAALLITQYGAGAWSLDSRG